MNDDNRRQDPRIEQEKRVLLEFNSRLGIVGITRDISRSGAYVVIPYPVQGVFPGRQGIFRPMAFRDRYTYPFKVIRVHDNGMAINFIDPPDDVVITLLKVP